MKPAAFLLLVLGSLAAAQDPKKQDPKGQEPVPAHPGVDQMRVDAAIKRGVEFLKTADASVGEVAGHAFKHGDELILLTFVHAGVPEIDPVFKERLKKMLEAPLERTYKVSMQAMFLEELDRVKYQWRIAQCAQFLVDNQTSSGKWWYGDPTPFVENVPTAAPRNKNKDVATEGGGNREEVATGPHTGKKPVSKSKVRETVYDPSLPAIRQPKPKVERKVPVAKRRNGQGPGDNSNSQYAALGLRACVEAGIVIPGDVIERARRSWVNSQHDEKHERKTDPSGTGRGWAYDQIEEVSYGSMTAGAIGSMVIYDSILGVNWKKDFVVSSGLKWLAEHFTVTSNANGEKSDQDRVRWHLYFLYAMSRAGILYGTESMGSHDWYKEGANYLLDRQGGNGSWPAGTWDTCFAVLFLQRATRPLPPPGRKLEDVASEDKSYVSRKEKGQDEK